MNTPLVSVIMGSRSDMKVMQAAVDILRQMDIIAEVRIISAHRTPEHMIHYAKEAADRGIQVIIAGAGGAAHLPGMVASVSLLPVIGVPVKSSNSLDGWDSLLSIAQMPAGIPVATMAVDGATNAGLLALRILSLQNPELGRRLEAHQRTMKEMVLDQDENLKNEQK